jgi:hypothetical protein
LASPMQKRSLQTCERPAGSSGRPSWSDVVDATSGPSGWVNSLNDVTMFYIICSQVVHTRMRHRNAPSRSKIEARRPGRELTRPLRYGPCQRGKLRQIRPVSLLFRGGGR